MVSTRWKASEVKAWLGYNNIQWRKFLEFTKEEGEAVLSFRDDYWAKEEKKQINKWLDVPAPIHEDLRKVVNEKLLAEGIPEVEDDVIYWRMIQLTRLALSRVNVRHPRTQAALMPDTLRSAPQASTPSAVSEAPDASLSHANFDPVYDALEQNRNSLS